MLIPSIDLMGGKIVQLIQGERKALEFDDFDSWIERFSNYPLVQLIDLDAAMGTAENRSLIAYFAQRLPCQVGGGIRSIATAEEILQLGAQKLILGSALIRGDAINTGFAAKLAAGIGPEKLVFACDSKAGKVSVNGWQNRTQLHAGDMIRALEPWCHAFLYTNIDTEVLMQGFPLDAIRELRAVTSRRLIAAGGITTQGEIDRLDDLGVDAVVGMAIYTATLKT